VPTPTAPRLTATVTGTANQLESFEPHDVAAAAKVIARYAKLRIGLADASIVVLGATDSYVSNVKPAVHQLHDRIVQRLGRHRPLLL
jgi:hypothetical protein